MSDTARIARILKALSNENRLTLFMEIARNERAEFASGGCLVSGVMSLFSLSAPAISHHLKELTNAELITTERQGRFVVARVNHGTVAEVADLVASLQASRP